MRRRWAVGGQGGEPAEVPAGRRSGPQTRQAGTICCRLSGQAGPSILCKNFPNTLLVPPSLLSASHNCLQKGTEALSSLHSHLGIVRFEFNTCTKVSTEPSHSLPTTSSTGLPDCHPKMFLRNLKCRALVCSSALNHSDPLAAQIPMPHNKREPPQERTPPQPQPEVGLPLIQVTRSILL